MTIGKSALPAGNYRTFLAVSSGERSTVDEAALHIAAKARRR